MSYHGCHASCPYCNPEEIRYAVCTECGEDFRPEDELDVRCESCVRAEDDTDDCAVLDSVDRATDIREAMR